MKRLAMAEAMAVAALLQTGCASMMNAELGRQERQNKLLMAGRMGDQNTVAINLLELKNVTEAPLWRTILCAAIDAGTIWGAYELGENQGWWGSEADGGGATDRAVTVSAGRDAIVIIGDGGPQAAEQGNATEGGE
jgi:hypothetical protein